MLKNLPTILRARIGAARRAQRLLSKARDNRQFSDDGVFHARIAYDLGLVYKATRRPALAREQLDRARAAAAVQKAEPMLTKIDAALASL